VGSARVAVGALYVRDGAGVSAAAINHLLRGNVVLILETVDIGGGHVWARISSGDVTGWVYAAFLE
jgi:hypothetical protein